MDSTGFWNSLEQLSARCPLIIDRPKGSLHPTYPGGAYPLDYGYLEGTTSGDGEGIDVWVGSMSRRRVTGVIATVDLARRDTEIKILLGCTPDEASRALAFHNSGQQTGVLLLNPHAHSEAVARVEPDWLAWGKQLQAQAQNGLAHSENPFDRERYEHIRDIAAGILAAGSGDSVEQVKGFFSTEVGHATPKVDVRGVVFRDDMILLVKERADGKWTVPGGWADVGESPGVGAAREVWEESGYRVRPVKVLAVYDREKHNYPPHQFHIYKLFYLCLLTGGAPTTSIETDEVGFFREDDIPPLSTGRVTKEQIGRFFEHHRHPDWPTDFD